MKSYNFFLKKGNSIPEYMILTSLLTVTIIGTTMTWGNTLQSLYKNATWDIEEPVITNTGFVSPYNDQKIIGIAKNYQGTVTFLFEEAGFQNSLGLFKVNTEGVIYDIRILFSNTSAEGSGGHLVPGESKAFVNLKKGDQIGFFIASNGYQKNKSNKLETGSYILRDKDGKKATIFSTGELILNHINPLSQKETPIRTEYVHNLFYSHANPDGNFGANADNFPHTVGFVHKNSGKITLGFEDLWSGGDQDYDDVILEFDVGKSNAAVLDPNLEYDYEGYDDWVNKLRLSEID